MDETVSHGIRGTISDLTYNGSPFVFPWESKWGTSDRNKAYAFGDSAASFIELLRSFRNIRPFDRGSAIGYHASQCFIGFSFLYLSGA